MNSSKDLITDKILKASIQLINQFGYGSLGLSEIARKTGITKQRLYYHYPTPKDIILVLANKWSHTGQDCALQALAKSNDQGALKILAISDGLFDWMKQNKELSRIGLVLYQSSPYIKKLQNFMDKARHSARDRIKSLLLQDNRYKKMKAKDLENFITTIHSFLYGFYFYIITMNDFDQIEIHEKNCREGLMKLLSDESY